MGEVIGQSRNGPEASLGYAVTTWLDPLLKSSHLMSLRYELGRRSGGGHGEMSRLSSGAVGHRGHVHDFGLTARVNTSLLECPDHGFVEPAALTCFISYHAARGYAEWGIR